MFYYSLKPTMTMNVNIQTLHFTADAKLVAFIEKKVSKLTQFHDRITKVDVFLKLDNVAHNIKDKIAEIHPPLLLIVKLGSFETFFSIKATNFASAVKCSV